jgi:dCTP deaminase
MKKGAFPDFIIEQMVNIGYIKTDIRNIKPSSIDLTLGEDRFLLPATISIPYGKSVWSYVKENNFPRFNPKDIVSVGQVVLAKLEESLSLRSDMYAYANPKSTTGRMDLHARLIADGSVLYDTVRPKGYKGELWVMMQPNSFPVLLPPGSHVNQLRFFNEDTRIRDLELEDFILKECPIYYPDEGRYMENRDMTVKRGDHSILLSLDLRPEHGFVGWVAKEGAKDPVNFLSENKKYKKEDYFEPVHSKDGYTLLEKGRFYILTSYEHLMIPNHCASEIAPLDERFGEFRSHYAGFIDPGWGIDNRKDGRSIGRKLTMEVRAFENIRVYHRQPIARLKIERMIADAKVSYDTPDFSNYQDQDGPKLAKYFF